MTWESSKGESSGEQGGKKEDETREFQRRVRGGGGTCSRKPQTLF